MGFTCQRDTTLSDKYYQGLSTTAYPANSHALVYRKGNMIQMTDTATKHSFTRVTY